MGETRHAQKICIENLNARNEFRGSGSRFRIKQRLCSKCDMARDRTGQYRTGRDRTGQDRTGKDRTGQDRTGQDRTGQNRTGQDRTEQALLLHRCISVVKTLFKKIQRCSPPNCFCLDKAAHPCCFPYCTFPISISQIYQNIFHYIRHYFLEVWGYLFSFIPEVLIPAGFIYLTCCNWTVYLNLLYRLIL
jgi:hypothetical protein